MFIDSHAHLYFDDLKPKLGQVLENAKAAGVGTIINVGVDIERSEEALRQTSKEGVRIFSTIGIHPHDADVARYAAPGALEKDIGQLKSIYQQHSGKVVAVGECGLDFFNCDVEKVKALQVKVFQAQIELSRDLNLPILIHCRDAWDEIFNYLDYNLQGVFHCWSGSYQNSQKALSLGFYISFAGNITYPKSELLREVAKTVPLDRLLIETDSPFLSPQTKRGQINEPANGVEVAKVIAQIKDLSVKEIGKITSENASRLFGLKS